MTCTCDILPPFISTVTLLSSSTGMPLNSFFSFMSERERDRERQAGGAVSTMAVDTSKSPGLPAVLWPTFPFEDFHVDVREHIS